MAAVAGLWNSEDRIAEGSSGYGEPDYPNGRKGAVLY